MYLRTGLLGGGGGGEWFKSEGYLPREGTFVQKLCS